MPIDLEKFRGALPYSAEMFGIYHPILGWKSRRTSIVYHREHDIVFQQVLAPEPEQRSVIGQTLQLLAANGSGL